MEFLDIEQVKSILLIIGFDLALGGDNAIVIALASKNLPEPKRNKAIIYGTLFAIAVRVVLTILALYLLKIPYLKLLGGVLLLYIAIKLVTNQNEEINIHANYTLLAAIKTIVFADIIMGFDNVLAISIASNGHIELVIIGLLISVPIIVWGSKIILQWMEQYPSIVYIGAGILAYTAGKTIAKEERFMPFFENHYAFHYMIPLFSILIVFLLCYVKLQVKEND